MVDCLRVFIKRSQELPQAKNTLLFNMLHLNSLRKKVAVLIILPLCLVMLIAGTVGLRLIGNFLLYQWEETAISKMERSAHDVDMRVMRPKEIISFLQHNGNNQLTNEDLELLLSQLKAIEGVIEVKYNSTQKTPTKQHKIRGMHRLQKTFISPISYDASLKSETVSIVGEFLDSSGIVKSHIEVVVAFYDLIDQIVKAPWWKGNKAFILNHDGAILASTERENDTSEEPRAQRAFGKTDTFEAKTWEAIQERKSGTVFSPGVPPDMVSGFYHLSEAPWTLVVMAAGSSVLQPILSFRTYYYLICSVGILFVALYLWLITGKATRSINRISTAATRLAEGTFDTPLIVESKDEIGALTSSFNVMSRQLKERIHLRQEMSLAGEIQNNLLPQIDFVTSGLEISVLSEYCDETGGDYVDILNTSEEEKRATVVVGDVVGHGVGAALLMTTLRALLRCRVSLPGSHKEIMEDVNKLLCDDTTRFGNFATLIYLTVDSSRKTFTWVRCGHDPALVFCPDTNSFVELKGEGLALGLDKEIEFTQNQYEFLDKNQIILVGTDGIWEVENHAGEFFGKERIKRLLMEYSTLSAREIADKILGQLELFSDSRQQRDDITLAIIKTGTKERISSDY